MFLVVDNRGKAYWSGVPSRVSCKHSITEQRLIELVKYLFDRVGNTF